MSYLTLRNIENLRVSQLSIELAERVKELIKSLPVEEEHIRDQLIRSSISISHNIAKAEQLYPKNKLNFYSDAIATANETKWWLISGTAKRILSKNEIYSLKNTIDRIIKMLIRILVNLKRDYPELNLALDTLQNVENNPIIQKAIYLVEDLHEIKLKEPLEWYQYIKTKMIDSACNIGSHISESEQLYPRKKLIFLNMAQQEINVVKTYLELMKECIKDYEKYQELGNLILDIWSCLIEEMKLINPEVQVIM